MKFVKAAGLALTALGRLRRLPTNAAEKHMGEKIDKMSRLANFEPVVYSDTLSAKEIQRVS